MAMEFLWEFFKNFDQNTSGIMLGIQFGSGLTGTLDLTYVSRYSIWGRTDGTNEGGYRSPCAGTSSLKISEFFKKSDDSGILLQF